MFGLRVSVVPPTAVTYLDAAGYWTPYPLSPVETVIATPGWLKCVSSVVSLRYSGPPHELETTLLCAAA